MEETLTVDGLNVSYDREGSGDHLLLIHGLGIGRGVWHDLVKTGAKLFTVWAIDLPGFGGTDMPDAAYGVPYYTQFLQKFMAEAGIDQASVVGFSLGGAVAASLAAACPDRVSRLVLIAPAGLTPPMGGIAKVPLLKNAGYWLMSHNKEMFRRSVEEMFYAKDLVKEALVNDLWMKLKNPAFRRSLLRNSQYLARPDAAFEASLASIKARTLVLWGAQDQILPAADAERFAGALSRADIRVLENCGHMVHIEQRETCVDTILSFLGEVDLYYKND